MNQISIFEYLLFVNNILSLSTFCVLLKFRSRENYIINYNSIQWKIVILLGVIFLGPKNCVYISDARNKSLESEP